MRFRKFEIPTPHPWEFPSRYPYFILEGSGRALSDEEYGRIKTCREEWRPTNRAIGLYNLLKDNLGKTLLLQVQNPENYYDSLDDLPKPFIATLKDIKLEKILDFDIEFEQFFVLISDPKFINGQSVFKEYNYDYSTLLMAQTDNLFKLNFSVVSQLSIEQITFWRKLFGPKKNGS